MKRLTIFLLLVIPFFSIYPKEKDTVPLNKKTLPQYGEEPLLGKPKTPSVKKGEAEKKEAGKNKFNLS